MQQLPLDLLILLVVQATLLLALIARIWFASLQRVYPYFLSYLVADLIQSLLLSVISFRSRVYPYFWLVTEIILTCLYALIVGELYRVVLRDLPGIASISRRYIKITLAAAIPISLILMRLEQAPVGLVWTWLLIERAVFLVLLIFVLLLTAFLVYYPIPLNRNVLVYSIGYATFFLIKATALFVRTLGYHVSRQISTIMLAASTACLLFWAVGLNRRGESRSMVIGHRWKAEDGELLLSKLQALNANLTSAAKNNRTPSQSTDYNVK